MPLRAFSAMCSFPFRIGAVSLNRISQSSITVCPGETTKKQSLSSWKQALHVSHGRRRRFVKKWLQKCFDVHKVWKVKPVFINLIWEGADQEGFSIILEGPRCKRDLFQGNVGPFHDQMYKDGEVATSHFHNWRQNLIFSDHSLNQTAFNFYAFCHLRDAWDFCKCQRLLSDQKHVPSQRGKT